MVDKMEPECFRCVSSVSPLENHTRDLFTNGIYFTAEMHRNWISNEIRYSIWIKFSFSRIRLSDAFCRKKALPLIFNAKLSLDEADFPFIFSVLKPFV